MVVLGVDRKMGMEGGAMLFVTIISMAVHPEFRRSSCVVFSRSLDICERADVKFIYFRVST